MKTYTVIEKATGLVAYNYTHTEALEYDQYPFSLFDHVVAEIATIQPGNSKFNGRRRLTHNEFWSLFPKAEEEMIDEFHVNYVDMPLSTEIKRKIRTYLKTFNAATYIDLDHPDYPVGLAMYVSLGLIPQERIAEVLNG